MNYGETNGIKRELALDAAHLSINWATTSTDAKLTESLRELIDFLQSQMSETPLGFEAFKDLHFCMLGLPGVAAMFAPTVSAALHTVSSLYHGPTLVELEHFQVNDFDYVCVNQLNQSSSAENQVGTAVVTGLVSAIRHSFLPKYSPAEIHLPSLSSITSSNRKSIEEFFSCRVVFDSDKALVISDAADLFIKRKGFAASIYESLMDISKCSTCADQKSALIISIENSFAEGHYSIKDVSQHLGIPERTLQRNLSAESITFSKLLDSYRTDVAMNRIRHTKMSLTEIATQVGLGSSTSLRNLFLRQLGYSPSVYANQFRK